MSSEEILDEDYSELITIAKEAFRRREILLKIQAAIEAHQEGIEAGIARILSKITAPEVMKPEDPTDTDVDGGTSIGHQALLEEPASQDEVYALCESISAGITSVCFLPRLENGAAALMEEVRIAWNTAAPRMLLARKEEYRAFRKGLTERPESDATGKVIFLCGSCEHPIGQVNTTKLAAEGLVAGAFKTKDGRPLFDDQRRCEEWWCRDCGDQPIRDPNWVLTADYEYLPVGPQGQAGMAAGSQPTEHVDMGAEC
jgi:hypothetical protein